LSQESSRISEPEKSAAQPQLSTLVEVLLTVSITALLLVPCFWLEHIEAGDLSSHVYNAWLATQIKSGAVSGLAVVPTWTNTLSDFALEALLRLIGTAWAERVVVGTAVLLFFWGTFSVVTVATGRRPWLLAPCIGMLSYGLIFHLGFLNYYVSTGLCLWAIVLLWRPSRRRAVAAAALLALATMAHVLPVAWAASVLVYLHLSRRVEPRWRIVMPIAGVVALGFLHAALMEFPHRWSLSELAGLNGLAGITGVEQVWLYGAKYLLVAAGLLFIWFMLFLERIDQGAFLSDPVAQLWLLHLVAFVVLPSAIQFPQYEHVLAYIPQRISLLGAVFLCITVGGARHGRGITRLSALIATVFFTFLYLDDRAFNALENEIIELVETLPPGQRVVAAIIDSDTRLNAPLHVVDRACIGHCFSYADYEPATAQFRIRVVGPSRVVAPTMAVVKEIEDGQHVVTPEEAPLYSVCLCDTPEHRFCLRALHAGERTCSFSLPISPRL
jgi:hypothetical protein